MPQRSHLSDLELPTKTAYEYFTTKILQHGNDTAMIDSDNANLRCSYADVVESADALAFALHQNGLKKGDRSCNKALVLPNCLEYPIIQLAVWNRGAICSCVNPVYTEYELHHNLQECQPKLVFATPDVAAKVSNINRKLDKQIEQIIVVEESSVLSPISSGRVTSLTDYVNRREPSDRGRPPPVSIDVERDLALYLYSSGTTGIPKAVMVTNATVVRVLHVFHDTRSLKLPTAGDHVPLVMPSFHLFGVLVSFCCLASAATLVVIRKYTKEKLLETIQDYKVRILFAVPPVLVMLAKDQLVDDYDIRSLQSVIAGAAPIGRDISEALLQRHTNIQHIMQGYGMTESGVTHVTPPLPKDKIRHGSCGWLAANYFCKVVDLTSGRELGVGETGELCVKGPGQMSGYLHRPQGTADTIDRDGWLHTGDIGYFDEDGFWYIVDRLKELIKVKGFQVAPAELEGVLLSHWGVQEAAVIGVADEVSGELPRAYVVRKADASRLSETELHAFVDERVAHYKRLKGGIVFTEEIPKSPSGKLLRRLLRDDYKKVTAAKI